MRFPLILALLCIGAFFATEKPARADRVVVVAGQPVLMRNTFNFTITCATAATPIAGGTAGTFKQVYCENNTATSVFYGGSNVGSATPNPCISTTGATCLNAFFSQAVMDKGVFCRVAAATQAIGCIGGE